MKIGDLTELATQNLREAILRNSLTTLGIAVGVASLVAMLSLGVGLQEMISRRLERNGLFNTVLVRPQTSFNATGQIRRNRDLGTDRPNDGNRNDRNQSVHARSYLAHEKCRDYIAAIERELVAWSVLTTATPQLWHW